MEDYRTNTQKWESQLRSCLVSQIEHVGVHPGSNWSDDRQKHFQKWVKECPDIKRYAESLFGCSHPPTEYMAECTYSRGTLQVEVKAWPYNPFSEMSLEVPNERCPPGLKALGVKAKSSFNDAVDEIQRSLENNSTIPSDLVPGLTEQIKASLLDYLSETFSPQLPPDLADEMLTNRDKVHLSLSSPEISWLGDDTISVEIRSTLDFLKHFNLTAEKWASIPHHFEYRVESVRSRGDDTTAQPALTTIKHEEDAGGDSAGNGASVAGG